MNKYKAFITRLKYNNIISIPYNDLFFYIAHTRPRIKAADFIDYCLSHELIKYNGQEYEIV